MADRSQLAQSLAAIRDRARLKAHLFSMDARERWQKFEDELAVVEEELTKGRAVRESR